VAETQIAYTELLGRRVRMGPWEDQKISTYRKILEALDAGNWDNAAELQAYFIDEADVCFSIYRQWIPDLTRFLKDHGVADEVIAARNAQVYEVSTLPDGSPWNPRKQWDRLQTEMRAVTAATYREQPEQAKALMAEAKET